MIGQSKILATFEKYLQDNDFPRFCIIVGDSGSGKKTLCKALQSLYSDMIWCYEPDNKVETVRNTILQSYKTTAPTCYIFADADNMSVNAKNAMLKVTEEPPNNSYFIMTLQNEYNTLDTIRSRATIFRMDQYTEEELKEYAGNISSTHWEIIKGLCDTPGDIDLIKSYDISAFYKFVTTTVDNIDTVSGANVFKLTEKLKLKDEAEGYDLKLFLKAFIKVCFDRYAETSDPKFLAGIKVTDSYLKDLRITGISKLGVIDLWILDIRREWM